MLVTYFSILMLSLGLITILIIAGAVASRRLNFNFAYVSLLSVVVYFGTSYWATSLLNPIAGITIVGLIGLFEATIGLKLIQKFKANVADMEGEIQELLEEDAATNPNIVVLMVLIYLFIGWLGTLFV